MTHCPHVEVEPVTLTVTGELVALLCVDCGQALSPSAVCEDCEHDELVSWAHPHPVRTITTRTCALHTERTGAP